MTKPNRLTDEQHRELVDNIRSRQITWPPGDVARLLDERRALESRVLELEARCNPGTTPEQVTDHWVWLDAGGHVVDSQEVKFDCRGGPDPCGGCGRCLRAQFPGARIERWTQERLAARLANPT